MQAVLDEDNDFQMTVIEFLDLSQDEDVKDIQEIYEKSTQKRVLLLSKDPEHKSCLHLVSFAIKYITYVMTYHKLHHTSFHLLMRYTNCNFAIRRLRMAEQKL